jgi:hypothetical protein
MTDPDARSRDVDHDARPDRRPVRDAELDAVNGGGRRTRDFVFVHKYDKASPVLI